MSDSTTFRRGGRAGLGLVLAAHLGGCACDPATTSGTVALERSTYTTSEGGGTVRLRVVRAGSLAGAVTVELATADGTATQGADYAATTVSVPFGDGDGAPKVVEVPILQDLLAEGEEQFQVALQVRSGPATLGPIPAATVTIADDDAPAGTGLDDTGVLGCATATGQGLPCASGAAGTLAFPGQDGERGRDLTTPGDADGRAGFSFLKLDAAGAPLGDQGAAYAVTPWTCVEDRVTGLTWEVHTGDGGPRDGRWRYSWYATSGLRPGFAHGAADGGSCVGGAGCDTETYVAAVNAARLCGSAGWRLPTRSELLSLVDFGAAAAPLIDLAFFPDGLAAVYWTGSADWTGQAWTVNFTSGVSRTLGPALQLPVRLVRGGKVP